MVRILRKGSRNKQTIKLHTARKCTSYKPVHIFYEPVKFIPLQDTSIISHKVAESHCTDCKSR